MADVWLTTRLVVFPCRCLSVSMSVFLSPSAVYLSAYFSSDLSVFFISVFLSVGLFYFCMSVSLSLSFSLSLSLSLSLYILIPFWLLVCEGKCEVGGERYVRGERYVGGGA